VRASTVAELGLKELAQPGSSSGWLCSATAVPQTLAVSRIRCNAWPACTQSAGRSVAVVSSPATPAARCAVDGLSGGMPQPCPGRNPGRGSTAGYARPVRGAQTALATTYLTISSSVIGYS
jgi:hypothetical protein